MSRILENTENVFADNKNDVDADNGNLKMMSEDVDADND